jgi:hypothetical protein
MQILRLLRQPFPLSDNPKFRAWLCVSVGLFVAAFLLIFQPFELNLLRSSHKTLMICGYGFVCTAILFFTLFIIPKWFPAAFSEKRWKVYSEIIFSLINISLVGLGNFLYSASLGFFGFSWKALILFQLITLLVGLIPVSISVLLKEILLLKKNLREAASLSEALDQKTNIVPDSRDFRLEADNSKDSLELPASDLLCISSADNYIEVFHRVNGLIGKTLLRSTMKRAEENLSSAGHFFRCHRAWIVNLDKVKSVSGNAQGYKLLLEDFEEAIPVSRSLNKEIAVRLRTRGLK